MEYQPGLVPVGRLHFDPHNPRLPQSVDGSNETAVLRWMLEDSTLLDLIGAIAADGYFPGEPVLVSPRPEGAAPEAALVDEEQHFLVVEGNRRLAAVVLLTDPTRAPSRRRAIEALARENGTAAAPPVELPAIVFRRRVDVLDHLGFRHVTGIKAWSPLAKANYVEQLVERARERGETLTLEDIAKMIGSKSWYVGRLLATRTAVDRIKDDREFFESLGVAEEDLPFSLMLVALGRNNIVEYLGLRSANTPELVGLKADALRRLATWLFKRNEEGKTALGESRNMTLLAEVVKSEEAMAVLDAGESIRTAAVLGLDPQEIVRVALEEAERQINLALRQRKRIKRLRKSNVDRVASLVAKAAELEELANPPAKGRGL